MDPYINLLIAATGNGRHRRDGPGWVLANLRESADILFRTCLLTTLSRVGPHLQFAAESGMLRGGRLLPVASECDRILTYVRRTMPEGGTGMTGWVSSQFRSSIPKALRHFGPFSTLMIKVARHGIEIMERLATMALDGGRHMDTDPRESCRRFLRDRLGSFVQELKVGDFFSHLLLANMEETMSDPFGEVLTVPPGHGGKQGQIAVCTRTSRWRRRRRRWRQQTTVATATNPVPWISRRTSAVRPWLHASGACRTRSWWCWGTSACACPGPARSWSAW